MTTFNDKLFMNVLNPISKGYAYVTPEPIRIGISNFFENIMFPVRFTNNLLQFKFSTFILNKILYKLVFYMLLIVFKD